MTLFFLVVLASALSVDAKWDAPTPPGNLLWQRAARANVHASSPAVLTSAVYFTAADNHVYAVDAATGSQLWNFSFGSFTVTSPVAYYDAIYVGTSNSYLYCINAATGLVRWRFFFGSVVGIPMVAFAPAHPNGVVYVGSEANDVSALDALSGQLFWRFGTQFYVLFPPLLVSNVLYVASEDQFAYALDATTGAGIWKVELHGLPNQGPSFSNGVVFFSRFGTVVGLRSSDGQLLYNISVGNTSYWPLVDSDTLFIGSSDGIFRAIYALNGDPIWQYNTTGDPHCTPVIAFGFVYTCTAEGSVYAFNRFSGSVYFRYDALGTTARATYPLVVARSHFPAVLYVATSEEFVAVIAHQFQDCHGVGPQQCWADGHTNAAVLSEAVTVNGPMSQDLCMKTCYARNSSRFFGVTASKATAQDPFYFCYCGSDLNTNGRQQLPVTSCFAYVCPGDGKHCGGEGQVLTQAFTCTPRILAV